MLIADAHPRDVVCTQSWLHARCWEEHAINTAAPDPKRSTIAEGTSRVSRRRTSREYSNFFAHKRRTDRQGAVERASFRGNVAVPCGHVAALCEQIGEPADGCMRP
jgi:hypothetical protein